MRSSIRVVQLADRRDQSRRVGRAVGGQLRELGADLVEREPDPLGEDDEGDPAQHRRAGSGGGPSRPARR